MRRTTRKEITDAYRARAQARQAGRRREGRERGDEQGMATLRTMIDHRQVPLEEGVGGREDPAGALPTAGAIGGPAAVAPSTLSRTGGTPSHPDPLHPTRWPWWD